MNTHRRTI